MASNKGRRVVGALIVLIGAVLLISAIFIPWYVYQGKSSFGTASGTITINSYPGLPSENGTIQCSSSGAASCPYSQTSYQKANYNNTGVIAETGFFLLIVGFVLGFIGAILGAASRGNPRRARPAIALAVIAMILAVITPLMFMATLPNAQSKDIPASGRATSSGPWSSFYGSNSSTRTTPLGQITESITWGPGVGWYLSFGAFVVLLIGLIILLRYRQDPPEPVPVSTPAPAPAATAPVDDPLSLTGRLALDQPIPFSSYPRLRESRSTSRPYNSCYTNYRQRTGDPPRRCGGRVTLFYEMSNV